MKKNCRGSRCKYIIHDFHYDPPFSLELFNRRSPYPWSRVSFNRVNRNHPGNRHPCHRLLVRSAIVNDYQESSTWHVAIKGDICFIRSNNCVIRDRKFLKSHRYSESWIFSVFLFSLDNFFFSVTYVPTLPHFFPLYFVITIKIFALIHFPLLIKKFEQFSMEIHWTNEIRRQKRRFLFFIFFF